MKNIPGWLKVVGAVALIALAIGAAQLLLWLDKMGNPKVGLD